MENKNLTKRELMDKLQEKENYIKNLEGILCSLSSAILLVDEEKNIVKVNNVISDMAHKTLVDIIGTKGGDALNCINSHSGCGGTTICSKCDLNKSLEYTLTTGKSLHGIEINMIQCVGGEKKSVWLRISTSPTVIENKKMVIMTVDDITKDKVTLELEEYCNRKERELVEIKESSQMKIHFLSNMSHELKTPLNIIYGIVQLLEMRMKIERELSVEVSDKYISILKQNCLRLIRLINNLIDITKFEENYIKIKQENRNIVGIIEDVTQSVSQYAKIHGIDMFFDTDVEDKIMAFDSDKMERVILNLLSNAIKFTEKSGKVEVYVKDLGERIKISVKDTGIGIAESKREKIFDRFEQADTSLTRNREGSGVGLSIVKAIVEGHEGTINVESKLNVGSTFTIELPVKRIEDKNNIVTEINCKEIDEDRIQMELSDIYL